MRDRRQSDGIKLSMLNICRLSKKILTYDRQRDLIFYLRYSYSYETRYSGPRSSSEGITVFFNN